MEFYEMMQKIKIGDHFGYIKDDTYFFSGVVDDDGYLMTPDGDRFRVNINDCLVWKIKPKDIYCRLPEILIGEMQHYIECPEDIAQFKLIKIGDE